jgi:hypothetical protein
MTQAGVVPQEADHVQLQVHPAGGGEEASRRGALVYDGAAVYAEERAGVAAQAWRRRLARGAAGRLPRAAQLRGRICERLWHLDFHECSLSVVTASALARSRPLLLARGRPPADRGSVRRSVGRPDRGPAATSSKDLTAPGDQVLVRGVAGGGQPPSPVRRSEGPVMSIVVLLEAERIRDRQRESTLHRHPRPQHKGTLSVALINL